MYELFNHTFGVPVANTDSVLAVALVDLRPGQLRSSNLLRLPPIFPMATKLSAAIASPMLLAAPPRHVPRHARHSQFLPRLPRGSARRASVVRRPAVFDYCDRNRAKQPREESLADNTLAIAVASGDGVGGV